MKPSNKLVKKGYWNIENCRLEALKYTRRKEFYKKCGSAYNSASRHGWLDEICAHMHTDRKPSNVSSLIQASKAAERAETQEETAADQPPAEGNPSEDADEYEAEEVVHVQITSEESEPLEEQAPAGEEEAQMELVLIKDPSPAKPKSKTPVKSGDAVKAKSKGKK